MDYNEALEFIHGVSWTGMKLGHTRIENLLEELDNPQKKLKFIHIAGTNGKGSTSSMLRYILMEAGYTVGLFISPFIERFNERIQVGTDKILDSELATLTQEVKNAIDKLLAKGLEHPTEFEIVTVIGFLYFIQRNCDIVVLEVGLGGRLDATNVIEAPEVSVITNIGFDHTVQLGDSLEEIATEKAGIIKNNCPVVLYDQKKNVEKVFLEVVQFKKAPLYKVDFSSIVLLEFNQFYQRFDYKNYKDIELSLLGDFQLNNCATVITTIEVLNEKGYNISKENIYEGLKKVKWLGRFEIFNTTPKVIIDGGHNRQGAEALANNVTAYFPNKKIIFVLGVMKDKDYIEMFSKIVPLAYKIITVTPDYYRGLSAEDLYNHLSQYHGDIHISTTITNGIKEAKNLAGSDDIICVFGSLYMAGEARRSAYV